jgi:hypothetical protein
MNNQNPLDEENSFVSDPEIQLLIANLVIANGGHALDDEVAFATINELFQARLTLTKYELALKGEVYLIPTFDKETNKYSIEMEIPNDKEKEELLRIYDLVIDDMDFDDDDNGLNESGLYIV